MARRGSTSVVAVALLGACLTQPTRPSFDDAAIAMACADQARAICAERAACSYMDYSPRIVFGDDATCVTRQALTCVNNLHVVDTSQTPAHVEECAQSYPGFSCASFFDGGVPDRCVADGPGATGTACSSAAQCASDYCATPVHQVCGTCQPQPVVGDACTTRADCGRDLLCAIPTGQSSGTCVLGAADGARCLTGIAPCVATEVCVGDDPATSTMGTCRAGVRTVGAACDGTRKTLPTCDPTFGLACITTAGAGVCQPILLVNPGDECGSIVTGTTHQFHNCAGGGLCVKTPPGATITTCMAPAADGAACSTDNTVGPPCLSPAICVTVGDSTTGTCTIPDPATCF